MDLFEVVNGRAIPSVHALMIEPYKSLWEKDTSPSKEEAVKLFSYVELLCSPKKSNPFYGYSETERPPRLRKEIWGDENYNPTFYTVFEILRCIDAYKDMLEKSAPGYGLYISAVNGAEKLKQFMDDFEPNERNARTGMLTLKPSEYNKMLGEVPDTIKKLKAAREDLLSELSETAKTRNSREIGDYER